MAKTRRCRWTDEEKEIHDRAVKIRKMTDRQIVELIDKPCTTTTKAIHKAIAEIEGIDDNTFAIITAAILNVSKEMEG